LIGDKEDFLVSSSTFLLDSPPDIGRGMVVLSLDLAVTIRRMAGKTQHWLSVVDGQLRFSSWRAGDQGGQPPCPGSLPDPAPEGSYGFVPDGPFLRVYVDAEKRATSEELAGKHGWYLTGDYSASPPQVILTPAPLRSSRWTLLKADHTYGHRYIRNENDLGRAAWLGIAEQGVRYQDGLEAHAVTLSPEQKLLFLVADLDDGK
jgi:hypothetical protein